MSLLKPSRNTFFFSKQYFDRVVKECPKLANVTGEPLNDYMLNVLAFNLAYNAFYCGKRQISIKLLHSIFKSSNLPDRIFRLAALLEIQMSIELNYIKLAQHLLRQLAMHETWKTADEEQKDIYMLFATRCNLRNAPQCLFENDKSDSLHWFFYECERQLKSGDSRNTLKSLFNRRDKAPIGEIRLLDNAIGCVFAFYLKDCNMADSYFRNAMLEQKISSEELVYPIQPSILIYHSALAQLGSGKPRAAGLLFLSVWPFFCDNPRIWLRISECCVHSKTNDTIKNCKTSLKGAIEGWNSVKSLHNSNCKKLPTSMHCSLEFAAYTIQQGLLLALGQKDFAYLLPYLYSLYAFVNIRLKQYDMSLKAASDLLNIPQINPRQMLMGMFFKTESLVYLNRLPDAISCLQQAAPLQSITLTFSRIVYNRALLAALNGEYLRSSEILNELNGTGNGFVQRPETNLLRMYLDMRLRRTKYAKQVFRMVNLNFLTSQ